MPHGFLKERLPAPLPPPGGYGVGQLFLPRDDVGAARLRATVEGTLTAEGFEVVAWRVVPVDPRALGPGGRAQRPRVEQVVVRPQDREVRGDRLEVALWMARRRLEARPDFAGAYVCSLSSRTLTYKARSTGAALRHLYPDLAAPDMASAAALVHVRFSTNTTPDWARAQPLRMVSHNGEINTLRGNLARSRARTATLTSDRFDADRLRSFGPLLSPTGSDSARLDEALELYVRGGWAPDHAAAALIPEAWEGRPKDDPARDFYRLHSSVQEPWDGPVALLYTDGRVLGARLDRGGLRPLRWARGEDDLLLIASEAGLVEDQLGPILERGRLGPGDSLLVEPLDGRLTLPDAARHRLAAAGPWRARSRRLAGVEDLDTCLRLRPPLERPELERLHRSFGWTQEDLDDLLVPMAAQGKEPVASMGADVPLPSLARRIPALEDHFRQRFAQVTNPPIDPLRERRITSTSVWLGPTPCPFQPDALAGRLRLPSPVLSQAQLEALRDGLPRGGPTRTLDLGFDPAEGEAGLRTRLHQVCVAAAEAAREGAACVVLSDRRVGPDRAPAPALLAASAAHHHLTREGLRGQLSLVVESGSVRSPHHLALLLGMGAEAVAPWLAFETLRGLPEARARSSRETAANLERALTEGLRKIMAKVGVTTVDGYRGAQLFEALGLSTALVAAYFPGVPSRIGGADLGDLTADLVDLHRQAWDLEDSPAAPGGVLRWRRKGEVHTWRPEVVRALHAAVREDDPAAYAEYARLVGDEVGEPETLRGALEVLPGEPVPLDEVEGVASIVRRFGTAAMSFGALSQEAHEALAIAMNQLGGRSNSGEGGEDPARFQVGWDRLDRNSRIKQVASGRFGVTPAYLLSADELQVKMAQGAKPGEGGQLPARKVHPWIAAARHTPEYTALVSPPPHHDIYSIEDLAQLLDDLGRLHPAARRGVKLVAGPGVGTIAVGCVKAGAEVLTLSGADGGTGAAARGSIRHAGLPWELGLAEVHQALVAAGLRQHVTLQVDGRLRHGRDLAVAALLGADRFGFGTAALVAVGCIMRRVCHNDTCPVGVATQDPEKRAKFRGTPQHVVRLMRFLAEDLRRHMARLGFRRLDEMTGRADRLAARALPEDSPAAKLDLSGLTHRAEPGPATQLRRPAPAVDLEATLWDELEGHLVAGQPARCELEIHNRDRTFGALLSGELLRARARTGRRPGRLAVHLRGAAGQSFGAFGVEGLDLHLEGVANDFVAKGLAGATVSVRLPDGEDEDEPGCCLGNVALYGATGGRLFVAGRAGERFAVRNSGADAVVEAVGEHACETMTGGRVVVLGEVGAGFAAGMTGGAAYLLDPRAQAQVRGQGLDLMPLDGSDQADLVALLEDFVAITGSERGLRSLERLEEGEQVALKVQPAAPVRSPARPARGRDEGCLTSSQVLSSLLGTVGERDRAQPV